MIVIRNIFFSILLSLIVLETTQAQTAEEIIDKYLESTGGLENWEQLKTTRVKGVIKVTGMSIPFTMYKKYPNKKKLVVEIENQKIIEAYDGETAWTINPFEGMHKPTKLSEEMQKAYANMSIFEDPSINYLEKGHKIELEGVEKIKGKDCFKIKLNKKNGEVGYHFFDSETYMRTLIRTTIASGKVEEEYYADYQKVDNIVMYYSMIRSYDGEVVQEILINEIETNPEIDDSEFAFEE